MATSTGSKRGKEAWEGLVDFMSTSLPHLSSWWGDEDGFTEVRIKARIDGTTLGIAKGFDSDGGPIVCFGSGYGVEGCFMALDAAIQGGRWRVDKPWEERGK